MPKHQLIKDINTLGNISDNLKTFLEERLQPAFLKRNPSYINKEATFRECIIL